MLRRYRATGADLPFGDPLRAHGLAMEGYFWRFTDARSGRVIVALCGVSRAPDGHWATVALAAHPGRFLREAAVPRAGADAAGLGAWAGERAFAGGPDRVRVDLGPDARLDVRLAGVRGWTRRPFGGCGAAHAVPALGQYWHPHALGGRASGEAVLGGERVTLDGWDVYAEKNWGRGGFPERWWWGQAQGFGEDACVAFAGGDVTIGPLTVRATALAVRLGDTLIRVGDPVLSPLRAEVGDETWRLRARGPVWGVEVDATAPRGAAHVLPVPLPEQRSNVPGAVQQLAGTLRVVVRRRGRVAWAGESRLAGLEQGRLLPASGPAAFAPRAARVAATHGQ